tara:strand:- start:16051 stop:16275 length:225 start_codon:yes stop_codon:yes gene_type:complete
MHKVTSEDGTVSYYRGNKLIAKKKPASMRRPIVKKPDPPKVIVRSLEEVYGRIENMRSWLQRPEMEIRLPEDKS